MILRQESQLEFDAAKWKPYLLVAGTMVARCLPENTPLSVRGPVVGFIFRTMVTVEELCRQNPAVLQGTEDTLHRDAVLLARFNRSELLAEQAIQDVLGKMAYASVTVDSSTSRHADGVQSTITTFPIAFGRNSADVLRVEDLELTGPAITYEIF